MDRAALDRARPDQGHLDHQVVELPRLEPGQGGHLGPALDLEHPDRVGRAQHLVDGRLLGQLGQVDLDPVGGTDQVDGVVQGREHPQAEQVELDQPDGGAVVLVPLQDAAVLHGRPLDRADLDHRPVADHHAAGVDPEVAREALDLSCQLHDLLGDLVLDGGLDRPPGVHLLGPGVELAGRVPEGPAHVAHGRAGLVGDHVGDLGGPVAAVALVDVLDDLLAAAGLDVQVDVGRPVALRGQEPLEQQAEGDGVGLGDPDGVADGRVGRRAPALAVDVGAAAELHDVPDDQEVAGEAELLDHGQLVVDLAPGARSPLGAPGAVAAGRAPAGQLAQPGHLGVAGRDREVGQAGRDQLQVEGKGPAELGGQLDRPRVAGQAGRLLEPGPQMGAGPGGQPAVQVGQGAAGPDRGQRGGQPAPSRGRVVDVVGRHHLDPGPVGQPDQGVVADRVERVAVVPDLHVEVVPPERLDEPVQLGLGRRRPPVGQRAGHRPLPAPGQHRPVPAVQPGQPPQLPLGRPLGPGHLRLRDRPAQPRIPLRPPSQHHQMLPARVGRPRPPRPPGSPWLFAPAPARRRPRGPASARRRKWSAGPAPLPPRRSGRCRTCRRGR